MKKLFFVIALACVFHTGFAVDIYQAPFIVNTVDASIELSAADNDVNNVFLSKLNSENESVKLKFYNMASDRLLKGKSVRSSLDASEICAVYGLDFLVYGFYRKSHAYYEMEIRLYDHETRQTAKTFYAKAETADREDMLLDIARRFVNYLYEAWDVSPEEVAAKERTVLRETGGFQMAYELGYQTPSGDWFGVYTGVFRAGGGFLVQPEDVVFYIDDYPVCFRFGIMLDYMLGLSKPDIEASVLHSLALRFPADFLIYFQKQHSGYAGIVLYYVHDIIYQTRLFGSDVTNHSGTVGGGIKFGYEYWSGEKREYSFGVEFSTLLDFFVKPRLNFCLVFQFKYRFPFEEGGSE